MSPDEASRIIPIRCVAFYAGGFSKAMHVLGWQYNGLHACFFFREFDHQCTVA